MPRAGEAAPEPKASGSTEATGPPTGVAPDEARDEADKGSVEGVPRIARMEPSSCGGTHAWDS